MSAQYDAYDLDQPLLGKLYNQTAILIMDHILLLKDKNIKYIINIYTTYLSLEQRR